jgi:hypothetical protein
LLAEPSVKCAHEKPRCCTPHGDVVVVDTEARPRSTQLRMSDGREEGERGEGGEERRWK